VVVDDIFGNRPLWYSGFCLTDQKHYALFFVDQEFMDSHHITDVREFQLGPDNLNMELDTGWTVHDITRDLLSPQGPIQLGEGVLDLIYWNWFKSKYPNMVVHKVRSFFGQQVFSLWVVLQEDKGKPVGILKTQPMEGAVQ
jgi:hypothetical protein